MRVAQPPRLASPGATLHHVDNELLSLCIDIHTSPRPVMTAASASTYRERERGDEEVHLLRRVMPLGGGKARGKLPGKRSGIIRSMRVMRQGKRHIRTLSSSCVENAQMYCNFYCTVAEVHDEARVEVQEAMSIEFQGATLVGNSYYGLAI